MDEKLKAVQAYDWGQSRVPLLDIDRQIRSVWGHAEHLAKIEAGLLEVLNSDVSLAAKRFVCQTLGTIGAERSVPALAALLPAADTSDMARYALERIPGDAVDKAFRGALDQSSGKIKAGLIDSIAVRKDRNATAALASLMRDADPTIAGAAAWALGQIGGPAAADALLKAAESATGNLRLAVFDACLACAENMRLDGKNSRATEIYRQLADLGAPESIRRAADRAMKSATSQTSLQGELIEAFDE